MNILVISGHLDPQDLGGAETHIVEAIQGLARKGHTLHVFVGSSDEISSLFDHKNIHVHTVQYAHVPNFKSFLYARAAVSAISKFLSEHTIDLIHAKQVFPQGLIGAMLKRKFPHIPLYLTAQNPLAYREELVLNLPLLPRALQHSLQYILKPFAVHAIKKADVVAAVSTFSEEESKKMGAKKTVIVPNGVHTKRFIAENNRPDDAFVVTTTSTLIPRNGVDILLKAFNTFHADHPESRLEIAGDGPMKTELQKYVSDNNLDTCVTFLGTLPHHKVPALLNRSHVFVRPSRFEGFGMSFIEAMACKIPVITCPVGGIPDFVEDGVTGLLVPTENDDELVQAFKKVYSDHELCKTLVNNAYAMVCERYDWKTIVDLIEDAYMQLV